MGVVGDITLGDGTKLIPVEGLRTGSSIFSAPIQTKGSKVTSLPEKSASSLVRGNVPRKLPEGGIPRKVPFKSKLQSTIDQRQSTSTSLPPIATPSTKTTSKSSGGGHPVFFSKTDNNANFNLRPVSFKTKPKQLKKVQKSQSEQVRGSKLAQNAFTNFPAVSEADKKASIVPKSSSTVGASNTALDRLLSIANGLQTDPVTTQSGLHKQESEDHSHTGGSPKDLKSGETPTLARIVPIQKPTQPDFRGFTRLDSRPRSEDSYLRGTASVKDPEQESTEDQVALQNTVRKHVSHSSILQEPHDLHLDTHRAAIHKVLQAEAKLRKLEEEQKKRYESVPRQIYKSKPIHPSVNVPNVEVQATSFIQPHSQSLPELLGQSSQHSVVGQHDPAVYSDLTSQHGVATVTGQTSQHGATTHTNRKSQHDAAGSFGQTSQHGIVAQPGLISQHGTEVHPGQTSQHVASGYYGPTIPIGPPNVPIVSGTGHQILGQHLASLGQHIPAVLPGVLPGHFSLPSIQIPPGHFTLPTHQTQAGHSTIPREQTHAAGHVNIPSQIVSVGHSQPSIPSIVQPTVQTPSATGYFNVLNINPGHFSLQSVPGLDVHQTQVAELLRAQEALRSLS